MHGWPSTILHTGEDLFGGLPSPLVAVRYHSLVVTDLPAELEVTAWTTDGVIMAVRHRSRPMWGVQFHPESIASENGRELLTNFRDSTPLVAVRPRSRPRSPHMVATSPPRLRPVVEHIKVDHHPRPDQVYTQLFDRGQGGFWLDGGARRDRGSRFTIIGDGRGPHGERITYDVGTSTLRLRRAGLPTEHLRESIFDYLQRQLHTRAVAADPALPFDFQPGFVGYLGYELKAETGGRRAHPSPYPDAALVFADRAVVIDHDAGSCYALCWGPSPNDPHSARWLRQTADRLRQLEAATSSPTPEPIVAQPDGFDIRHRCHPDRYRKLIGECLDLISAGETYEVCLTNALIVDGAVDPVRTFCRMRALNPAPYAALLEFDAVSVISASPERFLRITADRIAESKPIKGTRPRGCTVDEDKALRHGLVSSEKKSVPRI